VEKLLQEISPKERQAIRYVKLDGLSVREAAARSGMSESAVKVSVHGSGLGRLRWVVERTFAWLNQFRRLRVRYEKRADIHMAMYR